MKYADTRRPQFLSHYLETDDGARIRYFDTGGTGPALVLANGLGGPVSTWYPYFRRWSHAYRLISWDYRGLYGSTLPDRDADRTVERHAQDLSALLSAVGLTRATLVGWSMGVQVALEFYSKNQNSVENLVLVSGTYGRPLTGIPLPFSERALPPLLRGARRFHRLGSHVVSRVARSELSYPLVRRLGLVAKGLDKSAFHDFVNEFQSVNLDTYFGLLQKLSEHDAEPLLGQVSVPTLVIAGSNDVFTPVWASRRLAGQVKDAQLYIIPGGSHYAAAEYPDLVASRIEAFLAV